MPAFMQVSLLLLDVLRLWGGGEAQTWLQQSTVPRHSLLLLKKIQICSRRAFLLQCYSDGKVEAMAALAVLSQLLIRQ